MPDSIKARAIFVVISLLSCTPAPPIPVAGQVSGRVIDLKDRGPVVRAVVELQGSGLSEQTDSAGRFQITAQLPPGCHRLYVRFLGYGWTAVNFPASRTQRMDLGDVPLRPVPLPEWPLLLVNTCDAGPITKDEAPWGVDTLRSK
jgi:hypothetical protein